MFRCFICVMVLFSFCSGILYGEDKLSRPQGVFYDSKGRLYVADTGNHRVLIFDQNLKLKNIIGTGKAGTVSGEFSEPMDVVVDSKGRIIVADSRNHRIQIFSPDLKFLLQFGKEGQSDSEFSLPTNVTVDDYDHIIVTDRFNHRLQVFDKDGQHVFTLANHTGKKTLEELQSIKDYAIKRNQNPDDVNPEWQNTDWGQFNEPGAVYFDPKLKRLFVANGWNCRIEVLDYDSTTGVISRRDFHSGVVWGFWINRGCAGDDNPDSKIGKWQLETAANHGEHWNGIAWQLRHFTPVQYMRNMFGNIETAVDADNDGIPDNDPRLPFDEKSSDQTRLKAIQMAMVSLIWERY